MFVFFGNSYKKIPAVILSTNAFDLSKNFFSNSFCFVKRFFYGTLCKMLFHKIFEHIFHLTIKDNLEIPSKFFWKFLWNLHCFFFWKTLYLHCTILLKSKLKKYYSLNVFQESFSKKFLFKRILNNFFLELSYKLLPNLF